MKSQAVYEEFYLGMVFSRAPSRWVAAAEQNNLDLISDLKLRAMRAFGLENGEIMEIIGMAAFAVYANIIADATAMQNDEMFEQL